MRTMRLALFRHARAEDPTPQLADHDRPLTASGRGQARRTATKLHSLGWTPDLVLCSDAVRARQTLDEIRSVLPVGEVRYDRRIYRDGPAPPLREAGSAGTVLLVGHNPPIEELAGTLSREAGGLGTAHAALLEIDTGPWADALERRWRLVALIRPD